jgi:hypothetical protein
MGGVMLRRRPTRFGGALGLPNSRRFVRIFMIVCLLHPAASAIWDVVSGSPLLIISQISSGVDCARFGAILRSTTEVIPNVDDILVAALQ